jgi:enoyl-CoA hydratase
MKERKMDPNLVLLERTERVATIVLNRPDKRNALSPSLLGQFTDVLHRLREEGEVRCLVIRGAGEKAFCAGFDISEFPSEDKPGRLEELREKNPVQTAFRAIHDFPYPVIAMVNGAAYGAGCELTMVCDIRIACEEARFSLPPVKLGIVYSAAGVLRVIHTIGLASAKEMFFTGRAFQAKRAQEMGLVHYVVSSQELSLFTSQMAREISENAPLSLSALKAIFNRYQRLHSFPSDDTREFQELRDAAFASEDHQEGRRAFREKRKPVFKGR